MPLYEYCCSKCGQRFEVIRQNQDRDGECTCPHCQHVGQMQRDPSRTQPSCQQEKTIGAGSCASGNTRFR